MTKKEATALQTSPATPGSHHPHPGEPHHHQEHQTGRRPRRHQEEVSELCPGHDTLQVLEHGHCIQQRKHSCGVISKHEGKDSDALVVVAAGHRATDVAGHHSDEARSEQPRTRGPHFFGQEVGGYRCQATEQKQDVPNMHGNVEHGEDVMYAAGGEHEAGVNSPPHDAAQGIPRPLVEPVEEVVVAILDHVCCGPVVEPVCGRRAYNSKEPGEESGKPRQQQHCEHQQTLHPQRTRHARTRLGSLRPSHHACVLASLPGDPSSVTWLAPPSLAHPAALDGSSTPVLGGQTPRLSTHLPYMYTHLVCYIDTPTHLSNKPNLKTHLPYHLNAFTNLPQCVIATTHLPLTPNTPTHLSCYINVPTHLKN
ncbi:hypothetical protein E2C01_005276 [Portunus trituberculatus]|uniref:Uncharacterized protein n=1 Tax=Portunus trituberculatus TaxID=210409 RepID=A0A5B7CTL3_PORTR|nr:hypothetical protein [Portunus trituberculatus]